MRHKFWGEKRLINPPSLSNQSIRKIFLISLSSIGVLGLFVIAIYFYQIRYMPILDLNSLASMLGIIAVTAITFTILTAVLLFLPGFYWRFLLSESTYVKGLLKGAKLEAALKSIFLPFVLSTSAGFFAIFSFFSDGVIYKWLFILSLLGLLKYSISVVNGSKLRKVKVFIYLFFIGVVAGFMLFFPGYIFTLPLGEANGISTLAKDFVIFIYLAALLVFNTSVVVITEDVKHFSRLKRPLIACVFLFLIGSGLHTRIPSLVMQAYKLGAIESADLVINKDGCEVLRAYKIKKGPFGSVCVLSNTGILLRIGAEYYLENDEFRFTLPSKFVQSWKVSSNKIDNENND